MSEDDTQTDAERRRRPPGPAPRRTVCTRWPCYIVRRLLWAIVVVLIVLLLTFVVFFLLPAGDPALRFAGQVADAGVARARSESGWASTSRGTCSTGSSSKNFVLGDEYGWPGPRLLVQHQRPGADAGRATGRRARCCSISARPSIWLVIGVSDRRPLGASSAGRLADRAAMGFALFGISAPVFWLGLMALYIFWKQAGLDRRHGLRARSPRARPASSRT